MRMSAATNIAAIALALGAGCASMQRVRFGPAISGISYPLWAPRSVVSTDAFIAMAQETDGRRHRRIPTPRLIPS